tara:strand:+ start:461 stop:613 length:153 start_codon:yes stop_codon:yes gene_type:complete
MPKSIAKTNKALWLPPKPKEAIAGPGHKPANPHPTPKSTDPSIKSRSMLD